MRLHKLILKVLCLYFVISNKVSLKQNNSTSPPRFDFDLFKNLVRNSTNIVVSPFSIYSVLTLAANGASGMTQREMNIVLDRNTQLSRLNMFIKRSLDYLGLMENTKDSDVKLANAIFTKMKPSTYILSVARAYFKARVDMLQSSEQINTFVSNTTNNKIANIVDPMTVENAKMILVNAIYLKSSWMYPFDSSKNTQGSFKIDETRTFDCLFMNQKYTKGKISYYEDEESQILRLPYKSLKLHAFFLLPKRMNLMAFTEKLNYNVFRLYERKLDSKYEVSLSLPKFKIEFEKDMKDILIQMGMKLAFSKDADFSRITAERASLMIDKVLHKTFLEVSETGTEAAAATAATMNLTSSLETENPDLKKMRLDKPFIFLIRHDDLDQMLFMAKVEDF
jgi:serpin B